MNNNNDYDYEYVPNMYDENGNFQPFVGSHGNISSEIEHARNTYMESEREYFLELLANPKVREYIADLLENYDPEIIFKEAIRYQNALEYGNLESPEELDKMKSMTPEERDEFHFSKLEYAEGNMCLLFAAIRDKALILNLVKVYEPEHSRSSGRGM